MGSPVTMFDPSGQLRDVPQASVAAATQAGGEPAVLFDAPDGQQRWVRQSQKDQAIAAGGKLHQDQSPPQPGFLESLGHTFGIGKQEGEAQRQALLQHPVGAVVRALGGPALQAAEGLYNEFMRSTGQAGQAVDQARAGNPSLAAVHAAYALPFVGGGLETGVNQLGPNQVINPGEVGTALGTAIQAAPMVAEPLSRPISSLTRKGADLVAGTSPSILTAKGGIVPETQAANAKATAVATRANLLAEEKAAKTNADQVAQRAQELRDYHELVQKTRQQNEAQQAVASRKTALNRGVEQLDPIFKNDLTNLRDKANAEANAKYTALNQALDTQPADGDALSSALEEAKNKIKGSNTNPAILKDLSAKIPAANPDFIDYQGAQIPKGHPLYDVLKSNQPSAGLTYRDLQGYYSELGRELSKGTLPGDVYAAYDTLQDRIGDQMQKIADANNLGPQLQDARSTWRQMKQTFYDPKSPITRAINSTEAGDAIKQFQGKDQSGIQALAQYDPDLAQRANMIRGYQAEAKGLRPSTKPPKAIPELGPPPTPVQPAVIQPQIQSITPGDIQQAKAQALQARAQKIRGAYPHLASSLMVMDILRNALHGNMEGVATDVAARVGYGVGKNALASTLENPSVVQFLTKPKPSDVAMIPPDLARDMGPILDQAKSQGIKVSPALSVAIAAASPKKWYNNQNQ